MKALIVIGILVVGWIAFAIFNHKAGLSDRPSERKGDDEEFIKESGGKQ